MTRPSRHDRTVSRTSRSRSPFATPCSTYSPSTAAHTAHTSTLDQQDRRPELRPCYDVSRRFEGDVRNREAHSTSLLGRPVAPGTDLERGEG
ncbi:hypothetical protein ACFPM0_01330 [Pseudonocardia sulfidoxydans]|uniref:hypothetical protein n=1 Tax=Pseudonocardia sulfidoxydans TaxID=54011 RepID=UPI0036222EE2